MKLARQLDEGEKSSGKIGSPHVWELDDGNIAVIGQDITNELGHYISEAAKESGERIIKIPRRVLISSKANIPDQ